MTTLQNYDQYFRIVPNRITEKTKGELLELAYEKDAFVDISYKISFFKHPAKLQKYAPYGVAQMLRVTEEGSKIHKDKNRYNEYDGIYMPRNTIINYPLTDNPAGTNWYDEEKNLLTTTEYNGHAVILNAGGYYHNVDFKRGDKPRIVFQLCFEESLEEVWNLWNTKIYLLNI